MKKMSEKISKSKRRCPFCRGQKWICWDLFFVSEPEAIIDIPYVDFNLDEFGSEREYLVDECLRCGAVVS